MSTIGKQKAELEDAIVELQKSKTQLIRTEKMASLGILTAGVAHEINNPLNFIKGGLYGIEDSLVNPQNHTNDEVSTYLKLIENGINRISTIVTSLNLFSKDNITVNENYNIHHIIDYCLEILNNKMLNKIKLRKEYFAEPITITGHIGELHQIFINILNNSIQAIENEGIITIKTQNFKEKIVIEISDTGCGISDENMTKIFDPFFTTKDPNKGTGLGLSIAYRIIQEHNGKLEFHSELNKGTIAQITLPRNIE